MSKEELVDFIRRETLSLDRRNDMIKATVADADGEGSRGHGGPHVTGSRRTAWSRWWSASRDAIALVRRRNVPCC